MIVKPITFPNHQPLNRTLAAQEAQQARAAAAPRGRRKRV